MTEPRRTRAGKFNAAQLSFRSPGSACSYCSCGLALADGPDEKPASNASFSESDATRPEWIEAATRRTSPHKRRYRQAMPA